MIYELRTYTLRPGTLNDVVTVASTVSRDIRKDDYGKLEGYWQTEIGPLNQVMHLWSYPDLNQRAQLRDDLGRNPRWVAEYIPLIRPHLVCQETRLLKAVRAPTVPLGTPNIYELRNYRTKPGAVPQWLKLFTSALEVREIYSKIVGLWATEAPQVNEVCHIWAYPDLDARAAVRAAAGKDPRWQEFLKASAELLDELHSTVMLPAPHSPLQ